MIRMKMAVSWTILSSWFMIQTLLTYIAYLSWLPTISRRHDRFWGSWEWSF